MLCQVCEADETECGRPLYSKGFCRRHYYRNRKYGDPVGGPVSLGEPRRFFEGVVLKYTGKDCLTWPYGRTSKGYGNIRLPNGPTVCVHRLVCETVHGPAPTPKHQAAHECGNGHLACCNPHHLSWKTRGENFADMKRHGTFPAGERNGNAVLSWADVAAIRAALGTTTNKALAEQFGCSPSTIVNVKYGRLWREPGGDHANAL